MELTLAPSALPIDAGTASGKGRGDENFPVGSRLIAPHLRGCVHAFYAFARAADDIADDPALPPEAKLARLDRFGEELEDGTGDGPAAALRRALATRGLGTEHGHALLSAFRQDAVKRRYASLEELVDYCRRSANPVGRFLIDLHGEPARAYPASDALCTSLQVLNHLQDCGEDYRQLDRVYLPTDWMAEAGARAEELGAARLSRGMRGVVDRLLEACEGWNREAAGLSGGLRDRRFAAEAGAIVRLAARLARRLRGGDPLAGRVALTRGDFVAATLGGVGAALWR